MWKCICDSLGLQKLAASRLLVVVSIFVILLTDPFPKILSEDLGSVNIRVMSSLGTLYIPQLLFFSGSFMLTMLAWKSMSVHFKRTISPILAAVSFAICSARESSIRAVQGLRASATVQVET